MSSTNIAAEIERKYASRGVVKAGELLLKPEDALAMLDELMIAGVGILGVNVWYDVEDRLAEALESADMSTLVGTSDWRRRSQAGARQFIMQDLPPNTSFVSLIVE